MLAKNGLSAEQILSGALKTSMETAAASGADLSTAADITTDVMSNFKIQAKDLDQIANGISGVLLQSKFGIDDYRLALAQAGGVAGGLGVPMADFNAAIAATSSSFASGSDAGTSYKTFLQRLVPASKPARLAMERLGLEFFNADGSMRSMAEIAEELQDGIKGLSDEERNAALQDIFGTDAIRTAIQFADKGAAGIERLIAAIGKASAADQAAARLKGFWGEVAKTKSALEGLAIEVGELTLPGLEASLRRAQTLIAQMQAGFGKFEMALDFEGLEDAREAVGSLISLTGELMGLPVRTARSSSSSPDWRQRRTPWLPASTQSATWRRRSASPSPTRTPQTIARNAATNSSTGSRNSPRRSERSSRSMTSPPAGGPRKKTRQSAKTPPAGGRRWAP